MALVVFCDSDPLGLVLHLESGSGGSVWVSQTFVVFKSVLFYCSYFRIMEKMSRRVPTFDR